MWAAFPDMVDTIEDIVSNGSRVAIVTRTQGTHAGPFLNFAPTGRRVDIWAASIFELGQGPAPGTFVFTAAWGVAPTGVLLQQIGAFGAAPPAR